MAPNLSGEAVSIVEENWKAVARPQSRIWSGMPKRAWIQKLFVSEGRTITWGVGDWCFSSKFPTPEEEGFNASVKRLKELVLSERAES